MPAPVQISRATAGDVPAVEALLAAADMTLLGAAEAVAALGVVARSEDGSIVGAAALERFGPAGLLRSVVVAAPWRGTGVGHAVVTAAESLAASEGIHELYLLTETAPDWFPRLGFVPVDRPIAEAAVGASVEFTTVCRDKGLPMRLNREPGADATTRTAIP